MKYSLTVLLWTTQVIAEYEADTLKEIHEFIKEEYKRNLGQKQHFKDNCQAYIKRYTESTIKALKSCPEGCHVPECYRDRVIIKIKNFNSLSFENYPI